MCDGEQEEVAGDLLDPAGGLFDERVEDPGSFVGIQVGETVFELPNPATQEQASLACIQKPIEAGRIESGEAYQHLRGGVIAELFACGCEEALFIFAHLSAVKAELVRQAPD